MAVKHNLNSVQIFCNKGANEGSALHLTAIHNKSDVAEVLCRHNADVNAQDIYKETPLHYAVKHKSNQTT